MTKREHTIRQVMDACRMEREWEIHPSERPQQIRSKADFYRLWEAGVLGNKLRTWRDVDQAFSSGVTPIGFREVGKAGGGKLDIVDRSLLAETAARWRAESRTFVLCEAAPDQLATIQGEVCRTVGGWHGLLGRVFNGRRMRDSMAAGDLRPCQGVQVVDLLDRFMDPASRDDLNGLLEIYPDATVEFTCYSVDVGFLNRNTIFWEVRNY